MALRLKPAGGWRSALLVRMGNRQGFWPVRLRAHKLGFAIRRRLFAARHSGSELRLTASTGRSVLSRSWLPVLAAAVVVGLLAWADPHLGGWVDRLGLNGTWVETVAERKLSPGSYDAMLTAIAGVGGVFIALYFTAVSNVVATVYSSVPQGVRELIVADRYGNVYVRFISFLTALAILLLAVRASGVEPYRLASPLLALCSGLAIFAFAQLGRRTFYLADPSQLADVVGHKFQRWFARAKAGGWHWRDETYQRHYHRQARLQVEALAGLIDVAREREHLRGESLGRVVRTGFRLLAFHVASKPELPSSSGWFGFRQTHKQWYTASSLEVGFAASTGGTLEPRTEVDWNWAEERLLPKLVDALEAELGSGRLEPAAESLSQAVSLWTALGQTWSVGEARRWADELTDACIRALGQQQPGEGTPRAVAVRVGIGDLLGNLPVAAELGLFHSLRRLDTAGLRQRMTALDWSDPEAPYRLGLPPPALVAVEVAQRSLEFERQAGTPSPTPGWYIAESALREMAVALKPELDATLTFARSWFVSAFDRFEAAGRHREAAAVLVRGFESLAKLRAHLSDLETFTQDLEKDRLLDDTTWPSWDWEGLRSQLAGLSGELQLRQARSIHSLALEPVVAEVPDFLGQAMHQTGELCFQALLAPEAEKFAQVFPLYFAGMFTIFERVRDEAGALRPEVGAYLVAEPMLELADLSGHALICSELHQQPELWDACRDCWDKLIPEVDNLLVVVAASIASQSSGRMASPRTMLRSQREQALERRLEEVTGVEDPGLCLTPGGEELNHPSPLIRLLCADGLEVGSLLRASDVFVVRYLMGQGEAKELDFGLDEWRVRELKDLDQDPPAPEP